MCTSQAAAPERWRAQGSRLFPRRRRRPRRSRAEGRAPRPRPWRPCERRGRRGAGRRGEACRRSPSASRRACRGRRGRQPPRYPHQRSKGAPARSRSPRRLVARSWQKAASVASSNACSMKMKTMKTMKTTCCTSAAARSFCAARARSSPCPHHRRDGSGLEPKTRGYGLEACAATGRRASKWILSLADSFAAGRVFCGDASQVQKPTGTRLLPTRKTFVCISPDST